jgi:hypothetical protein
MSFDAPRAASRAGSKTAIVVAVLALLGIATAVSIPNLVENVDARTVVVIQSPISGDLAVYTEPGWKWQGFGKVTIYPRRDQFSFSVHTDQGKNVDESMSTRFNDGGHGNISGTMNWAMPLSTSQILAVHKDFGSIEAVEQQLIRTSMQKVVYNVGPTMSSTESTAEKRPEIPKYIDDQLANGPYLTKTIQQEVTDAITGQKKMAAIVTIATDASGKPLRESISQIAKYGLLLQPVAINKIAYDDIVEKQITERQRATTQVQIAIANAKKAEQDAITITEQGKAAAAKTKWEQEAINAKEIAEAEKEKQVATLSALTAEQLKRKLILEGEGEAQKRALILNADGALDKKLDAYVKVNVAFADAIKGATAGAWTPQVQMGATGAAGTGNSAQSLIDMISAKTATELGLDRTITKGAIAKK